MSQFRLSDFWCWDGTIDRGPYVLIGVVLFALKHNLDRFTASLLFHRPWSLFNYLIPSEAVLNVTQLSHEDRKFYLTLVATALPFIYIGVMLTVRRLRATHLPTWLVVFFFLPLLNLLFFLILGVIPSRETEHIKTSIHKGWVDVTLGRILPDHPVGSAAMAVLLIVPLTTLTAWLSVSGLGKYGWGVFVGLPFALGLGSVVLHGYHRQRSFGSCLAVSCLSVVFLGLALGALAIEGVICLAMAAPIGIGLAMMGGAIGYLIQLRPNTYREVPRILLIVLLFSPIIIGAEYQHPPEASLIAVRTAIEIDAPPEKVWRHVVSFSELPPPDSWLFNVGVAYPMRAEIKGTGVGAVRHCVFSTGPFVEPIEVWDEPRLLKFSVSAQPPAMRELSYIEIDAPHLSNYLVSEGGQFFLTPLPGGRTRLEGTTWYRHRIWPATYWQVWSDTIIHRIHLRVLKHVKQLSEEQM